MTYPTYFESFDYARLLRDYPIGDNFASTYTRMSRDALRAKQNGQFMRCVVRAWQIPFYQRLWGDVGIEPGDIKSLDDITKLPTYSKSDLMKSVAEYPPFGDFHGMDDRPKADRPSMIFHTTSGTTGTPQPLFFSPKSRELQSLLLGRVYRFQGLSPQAVMHSVYGHGMINGGHYVREAVLHYTNAIFLSAGTGVETRSLQQVELMKTFGVNVIVGFADYIKKLADVARSEGIVPGRDIHIEMISGHMGRESKQALSESWGGPKIFDWYGVGDTGAIAAEGPDQDGLYLMEDAQYVELCDPQSSALVGEGEAGNMVVTCLYKDDIYPIIRFNTNDVTELMPGESSLGLCFHRIRGFLGRSDNMIKLRGINIYPQGIGPILEELASFAGEFICIATRDANGRDDLTVAAEVKVASGERSGLVDEYQALLKRKLGVEVTVELADPGSLAPMTGIETRQKPIRLLDKRFK